MEGTIRRAILKSEEPTNEILVAIRDVCARLENANTRFEMEKDSDLIESCIYEIESLRAKYRYLLRIARQQGLRAGTYPLVNEGEKTK
ncbi:MAG: DUF2508 family protein [Clostridiales bacterium]|jgi:hypothetical protein|nr:DUF2508 family protein [Clostridiales bacterium]